MTITDGLIRLLDADGKSKAVDIEAEDDAVKVVSMAEFKRLSHAARTARSVKARRTLPRKYSVKDNEPVLFAGRLPAKRDRDGRSRPTVAWPRNPRSK